MDSPGAEPFPWPPRPSNSFSASRATSCLPPIFWSGTTASLGATAIGTSSSNEPLPRRLELANVLDLGKVALGGLIDRLEEGGFVERRSDPKDRRINRVYLTSKGTVALEKMQKVGMEMNEKIMSGISPKQQHQLAELLHIMKGNLVAMDVVPGSRERRDTSDDAEARRDSLYTDVMNDVSG